VSNTLNIYIIFLVVMSVLAFSWLLYVTKDAKPEDDNSGSPHTYDGIVELNEPLPLWWLWLAVISICFTIGYLTLYPGLGKFKGWLDWNSRKDCDQKIIERDKLYDPIYSSFSKDSVEDLSNNLKALKIGRSLFVNNCSLCHGLYAKGGNGFPNLTNNIWLYGGTPNEIKMTITNGRRGKMPPYGVIIKTEDEIEATALYVLSLSGREKESALTQRGKVKFSTICSACHGLNAKGNKFIGAPDLTNPQWIHGGTLENIKFTIKNGRNGVMPAHKDVLTKEQIHILTAYIYSLNKS